MTTQCHAFRNIQGFQILRLRHKTFGLKMSPQQKVQRVRMTVWAGHSTATALPIQRPEHCKLKYWSTAAKLWWRVPSCWKCYWCSSNRRNDVSFEFDNVIIWKLLVCFISIRYENIWVTKLTPNYCWWVRYVSSYAYITKVARKHIKCKSVLNWLTHMLVNISIIQVVSETIIFFLLKISSTKRQIDIYSKCHSGTENR